MRDLSNVSRGRWGETRAAHHLERRGHRIVDRNWRSPERYVLGDIDLISISAHRTLVFCEVKTRRAATATFGGAAAAVSQAKQTQIRLLAESWIRTRLTEVAVGEFDSMRFDVIAIDGVRLTHFEAAF